MAKSKIENITDELTDKGFNAAQVKDVIEVVAPKLPAKVYKVAAWFLGLVTAFLVLGAIGLAIFDKALPEVVWGVAGACVGGLAGVVTGE